MFIKLYGKIATELICLSSSIRITFFSSNKEQRDRILFMSHSFRGDSLHRFIWSLPSRINFVTTPCFVTQVGLLLNHAVSAKRISNYGALSFLH